MKREKGAALLVVLSLLTVSLMMGLSSMQSSLIDERLAGNYKAATQAQMGAEQALSEAWKLLRDGGEPDWISIDDFSVDDVSDMAFPDIKSGADNECDAPLLCYYQYVEDDGDKYIVAMGGVSGGGGVRSLPVVAEVVSAGAEEYDKGVVGCEGIRLGGGPQVDSYNSSYGAYGESVVVDGQEVFNGLRREAVVKALSEGASLSLSGNSPVYGRVEVPGDLSLDGGTPIYGNVMVDGDVDMNGTIYGNLVAGGNVAFGTASTMEGEVTTGGNAVIGSTNNPPASITASGSVSYPEWWKWDDAKMELAANYHEYQSPFIPPVYNNSERCDPVGVTSETGGPGVLFDNVWDNEDVVSISAWFEQQGCGHCYAVKGGRFSFTGGSGNNDAASTELGLQGETTYLRVDQDVTAGGRLKQLLVKGDVTLVVDGDFDLGNNTRLVVDENSTLTVLVTGKTRLGGGSQLLSSGAFVRDVNGQEKRPAIALYSSYGEYGGSPNSAGVTVSGANNAFIDIVAPDTDVVITGSGSIFGALRAGWIDMRGSGDIHFDEALKEVSLVQDDMPLMLDSWH
ncbi:PilX N-terminal domain-containing pilus assembly protein [Halomonas sp. ND22Bw]|uniref:DUF7305 domain-containing protein n=1 Tax=Halomonas sp. ND22Bw TaxID=2054178 RepID=UPI0011B242CF